MLAYCLSDMPQGPSVLPIVDFPLRCVDGLNAPCGLSPAFIMDIRVCSAFSSDNEIMQAVMDGLLLKVVKYSLPILIFFIILMVELYKNNVRFSLIIGINQSQS